MTRSSQHGLQGRVVAAGAAAREAIARLLGLDAVSSVGWRDHAVEVAIQGDAGREEVLRIERRRPESRGLLVTEHLNVYARGTGLPAGLARHLQEHGPAGLSDWTVDELGAVIEQDPGTGKIGAAMPPQASEEKRPRSQLDTWGRGDVYADFFAGGELSRGQLDSIDPSKVMRFVQHGDQECLCVNPHSAGTVLSLVNFPWDERVRSPMRPQEQGLANTREEFLEDDGMVTTDLDENDVIMGNPGKLQKVLGHAVGHPGAAGKLLLVSNTCVPTVIGDDVESAVKRARKESGKDILFLAVTPRSMTNIFQKLLVDRRLAAESAAPAAASDCINLVGFPSGKAGAELQRDLGAIGIRVNARLLPELSHEAVDALPRAALTVFHPNKLWQHLYDQMLVKTRTPWIDVPAPYGFEGTRAWLEAVASKLGRGAQVPSCWDTITAARRDRWQELCAAASKRRLGFVVRDTESFYLTTPASTWGVPLLSLVEEMGFGADVLVHVSDPVTARDAAIAIRKVFRGDRHSVRAFDSLAMLRQRLKDSPAEAFLSYHYFDWRLTEAGKGAFSLQHFEMGIAGAVRTLERLLCVCDTPFYRQYARYLARPGDGAARGIP